VNPSSLLPFKQSGNYSRLNIVKGFRKHFVSSCGTWVCKGHTTPAQGDRPFLPKVGTRLSNPQSCTFPKRQYLITQWLYASNNNYIGIIKCTIFLFLFVEGPRSRCYGRTAALKAYCATLWGTWSGFVCFYVLMEHRWNEIDRGKPKYSGEKPVPAPLCPPQIPHGTTRDRTRASAVRGRRLTAWATARPDKMY
jgi:hypothetical protein